MDFARSKHDLLVENALFHQQQVVLARRQKTELLSAHVYKMTRLVAAREVDPQPEQIRSLPDLHLPPLLILQYSILDLSFEMEILHIPAAFRLA